MSPAPKIISPTITVGQETVEETMADILGASADPEAGLPTLKVKSTSVPEYSVCPAATVRVN